MNTNNWKKYAIHLRFCSTCADNPYECQEGKILEQSVLLETDSLDNTMQKLILTLETVCSRLDEIGPLLQDLSKRQ